MQGHIYLGVRLGWYHSTRLKKMASTSSSSFKGNVLKSFSSVEVMVVEKFERRNQSSSGREFVVGMIIESGHDETNIKPCYINELNSEACAE